MPRIEPGMLAPNFRLTDQHGERHTLAKLRGRVVVLYFYPKDDTPECTIEACQFRDHHPDFSKIDAAILGVSPDGMESHAQFAVNHQLDFPLLCDTQRDAEGNPAVCGLYGTCGEKSMYGRSYTGVVRTTFIIDPAGMVRRRWDRVKVTGHAAEVLATVKLLRGYLPAEIRPSKKRASETKARRMTRTRGSSAKKPAARRTRVRAGGIRKVGGKAAPANRRARTRR